MRDTTSGGGSFVDRVKGKAKQWAGAATDDEHLRQEGQLHEEKADVAEEARRLDAEAALQRQEAEVVSRQREAAVENQKLAVERGAEARKEQVDRQHRMEERRLAADHAQLDAAVEAHEERQHEVVDADKAAAAREWAEQRREASTIEAEAARARAAAEALERAAESQ